MSNEIVYSKNLLSGAAYPVNVARGLIPGATAFGSFGKRTVVGAVTQQLLWPGSAFLLPPAVGVQVSFVSTSAQDGVAGTGIQSVDMHYVDSNLVSRNETITLNGLTPVLSVATNVRFIQCLHGLTWGTGKAAAGTITASNAGNTYSLLIPGEIRCASSARMVPAGKKLLVSGLYASSVSPGSSETSVIFCSTQFEVHDFSASSVFSPLAQTGFQDGGVTMPIDPPFAFAEGACVAMQYTQSSTATVTGGWFGWLEDV